MTNRLQVSSAAVSISRLASKVMLLYAMCIAMTSCGGPVGFGFEYTSISVIYPGIDIYYQAYPGSKSEEHVKWIEISKIEKSYPWTAKIVPSDGGDELELADLDASKAEAWANKQIAPRVEKDDKGRIVRIDIVSEITLQFDADEKLSSARIVGWYTIPSRYKVTFTTDKGTVAWPCGREELKTVLGEPTKTEIEKQFDKGVR